MSHIQKINEYLDQRIKYYIRLEELSKFEFDKIKAVSIVKDDRFHRHQNLYDGYSLILAELRAVSVVVNQV